MFVFNYEIISLASNNLSFILNTIIPAITSFAFKWITHKTQAILIQYSNISCKSSDCVIVFIENSLTS